MEDSFLSLSGFNLIIDIWVKNPETIELSVFTRDGFTEDNIIYLKQFKAINNGELELKDNNDGKFRYRKYFHYPDERSEIDTLVGSICEDLRILKNK